MKDEWELVVWGKGLTHRIAGPRSHLESLIEDWQQDVNMPLLDVEALIFTRRRDDSDNRDILSAMLLEIQGRIKETD